MAPHSVLISRSQIFHEGWSHVYSDRQKEDCHSGADSAKQISPDS